MYRNFFCLLLLSFVLFAQSCTNSTCTTNSDCLRSQFCTAEGVCLQGCGRDEDCDNGKVCSDLGRCVDNKGEKKPSDANTPQEKTPDNPPGDCQDGQERPCSTGDTKLHGIGVCKPGKQVCVNKQWGACIGEVLPSNEVCDKKDNDCDGQVDEELKDCGCSTNSDCPPETPNCQAGQCIRFCKSNDECRDTFSCKLGYCQACADGGARSKKEECNGKDDDCDGQMDEGLSQACGTDKGVCRKGTQVCVKGAWDKCTGNIEPKEETCNNLDDNCNGQVDENVTQACGSSDVGDCKKGTQTCKAGVWEACVGNVEPKTETCNNKDDNCDGKIDESVTQTCGSDVGECKKGTQTCNAGAWSACTGDTKPGTETCNGKDDNCDGKVDEGLTKVCGSSDVGACKKGKSTCEKGAWGPCVGSVEPRRETCDKTDDDCDGKVDEDVVGCGCKQDGECPANKPKCQAGVCTKFCTDSSECLSDEFCHQGYCQVCSGGAGVNKPELCNDRDDDCDGTVDEGLTRACGDDTGACQKGTQTCVKGAWGTCAGEVTATTEVCNGKDDDCDGQTDEAPLNCFIPANVKQVKSISLGEQGYSVKYNHDGTRLVTSGGSKAAKIWDASTYTILKTIKSPNNYYLYRPIFSPDGKTIAYSHYSAKTVEITDINTGNKVITFPQTSGNFRQARFSPDGKYVVGGNSDRNAYVWEVSTGKLLHTLSGTGYYVEDAHFSPDGKTIATVGDKNIRLWEASTGTLLKTLAGHSYNTRAMDFSPDGKTIIVSHDNAALTLWDVATGKQLKTLTGHTGGYVYAVVFSPDGKTIVSGGGDATIRIWEVSTGKLLKTLTGHTSSVRDVSFHPSGRSFASTADDSTVRFWK